MGANVFNDRIQLRTIYASESGHYPSVPPHEFRMIHMPIVGPRDNQKESDKFYLIVFVTN